LLVVALVVPSAAARADTIFQSFTITLPNGPLQGVDHNFGQFNPSNGTLIDVQVIAVGSAIWTSSGADSLRYFLAVTPLFEPFNTFDTPGLISFRYIASSTAAFDLSYWTGLGTQPIDWFPTTFPPNSPADTITNGSLTGILEFDFTPNAPVPEPSTWAMMLLGFAGLGCFAFRQSRRKAAFA
jgi:hypothetical protein